MRPILHLFIYLFLASSLPAAETSLQNAYDFKITSETGQVLGKGKIRLPFKFGSDGTGTTDCEFTPTKTASTNKYWLKAKARLASGKGKANAECKDGCFTLDFNPGVQDYNVRVGWVLKERNTGVLYFCDFAGGHPCGSFRIIQSQGNIRN